MNGADMDAPLGAEILTISSLWNQYREFENYNRSENASLEDFLSEWNQRMLAAQTAGFQYSDLILACKLLEKANLSKQETQEILQSIEDDGDSKLMLMDVVSRLESHQIIVHDRKEDRMFSIITVDKQDNLTEVKKEAQVKQEDHANTDRPSAKYFTGRNVPRRNRRQRSADDLPRPKCPHCFGVLDVIYDVEPDDVDSGESSIKLACGTCDIEIPISRSPPEMRSSMNADGGLLSEFDGDDQEVKDEPVDMHNFLEFSVTDLPKRRRKKIGNGKERKKYPKKPKEKPSEESLTCEVCGRVFVRPARLRVHLFRVHGVKRSKTKEEDDDENPGKLKRRHMEGGQCEYCGRNFKRVWLLKQHYERCHSGTQDEENKAVRKGLESTICKVCGKTISRLYNYKSHMRLHTGEKSYKCDECPATFAHSSSLGYHKLKHRGERPFKCDQCPKAFYGSSNLVLHMKREHQSERPYQCEHCSYNTVSKFHLKRHLMSHTGERPYKCDFCDKAYRDVKSRKRHMKVHAQNPGAVAIEVGSAMSGVGPAAPGGGPPVSMDWGEVGRGLAMFPPPAEYKPDPINAPELVFSEHHVASAN